MRGNAIYCACLISSGIRNRYCSVDGDVDFGSEHCWILLFLIHNSRPGTNCFLYTYPVLRHKA